MIVSLYPMLFKTSHGLYLNSFQFLKLPDHTATLLGTFTRFFASLKPVLIETHLSDFAMELQVSIDGVLAQDGVHQELIGLMMLLADAHLQNHSGVQTMFKQIY